MASIYPDSIRNDKLTQKEIKKNGVETARYVSLDELESDFVCVQENTGTDIPPVALGQRFKMAKDYWKKKNECDSKFKPPGEATIYIRRDDWINPKTNNYECGIFELNGNRLKYDDGMPMKIPSKNICNLYNKPRLLTNNNGRKNTAPIMVYSKYVPKRNKRPIINLKRGKKKKKDIYLNDVKNNLFFIFIILACVFYIIWIVKFNALRPYTFFEHLYKTNFKRIIIILMIIGIIIYIFCPFNTCYIPPFSAPFIEDPSKEMHTNYCKFINYGKGNNLANYFISQYDDSSLYQYFTLPINFLSKITYDNQSKINYLYNTSCIGCEVKHGCIDRHGTYDLRIKKIRPLVYNSYKEFNKIKNNDFNWDSVAVVKNNNDDERICHLYLRTHWYEKKVNKERLVKKKTIVFIGFNDEKLSLIIRGNGGFVETKVNFFTDIIVVDNLNSTNKEYLKAKLLKTKNNNPKKLKIFDINQFKKKVKYDKKLSRSTVNTGKFLFGKPRWVKIRSLISKLDKKNKEFWALQDYSITTDLKEINMKYCAKTFKILGINENYSLIGYNIPISLPKVKKKIWQVSPFLYKVINNDEDIYRYMPDFKLPDAINKGKVKDSLKPYQVRKVVNMYLKLITQPSFRLCTKNHYFLKNKNPKKSKTIKKEFEDKNIINYLKKCNEYINNLSIINDYWNDDEDDDDYEHYTEEFKKLNNELRIKFRNKEVEKIIIQYNNFRKKNKKIVDTIYKNNKENIVNMHSYSFFRSSPEGNTYKCIYCKQSCTIK
jgi:hypothetical protein